MVQSASDTLVQAISTVFDNAQTSLSTHKKNALALGKLSRAGRLLRPAGHWPKQDKHRTSGQGSGKGDVVDHGQFT
jgi:hypothetical protein